jgi:TatD DNase family protein
MIIDTHCHVFWKSFDQDRAEVLARARTAGVLRMIVVGTDLETSLAALQLCAEDEDLFPTAGIHPHDSKDAGAQTLDRIRTLCERPECVAVGETGLDYFKGFSPRENQIENFRWHLELARELDKPVIVHCRDAHEDASRLIAEYPGVRGVMHCYTMGPRELEPYLAAGFCISFSGVVTYKANEENRAAARAVPADRLLVETDCPFLAPEGKPRKRNEPAWVALVLEKVAEVRGTTVEDLARVTTRNAEGLFALPG